MQISGASIINCQSTCTLLLFETRNKRLSDTHYVQRNTSTLFEGNNTPFIDSRLKTLEFQLFTVLLQLFELNSSNVSMPPSFSEDYMSFNFKRETRVCTCVIVLIIQFLCFIFTHLFKFKDPKFQLRSSLKVSSDCYIRNFNFEPMLTSHARSHTLLREDIMIQFK